MPFSSSSRLFRWTLVVVIGTVIALSFWRIVGWDRTSSDETSRVAIAVVAEAPSDEPLPVVERVAHLPIVVYHSVRPLVGLSSEQRAYSISPEAFRAQLQHLKDAGYHPISLALLVDWLTGQDAELPDKPVVLTFDDGLDSQYLYAWPPLRKSGFPATFFLYVNPIGRRGFMTWDQVTEIQSGGMTFGSHTRFHPFLHEMSDEDALKEITDGKRLLEDALQTPVDLFAWPFGISDDRLDGLVRQAGFRAARGLKQGNEHSTADLFDLHVFQAPESLNLFKRLLEN